MDLIARLVDLLPIYGPWLIFSLAVLETCFVTGFAFPSGLATSVATVLAYEGRFDLGSVILAAGAGGFVGDSVGYWVGVGTAHRIEEGSGMFTRQFKHHHYRLSWFFGRHPVFSVTVARLVAFVRTLMPMAAGMSGLTYPRFLMYEVPGLIGWVALYVLVGLMAGESWAVAVQTLGVSGAALFAAAGVALWMAMLRRRSRAAKKEA